MPGGRIKIIIIIVWRWLASPSKNPSTSSGHRTLRSPQPLTTNFLPNVRYQSIRRGITTNTGANTNTLIPLIQVTDFTRCLLRLLAFFYLSKPSMWLWAFASKPTFVDRIHESVGRRQRAAQFDVSQELSTSRTTFAAQRPHTAGGQEITDSGQHRTDWNIQ